MINSSGNRRLFLFLAAVIVFSGCAAARGPAAGITETPSPLVLVSLAADKGSPQTAGAATVHWQAHALGGAGERTYHFLLSDGKKEVVAQSGPSSVWEWRPEAAGTYRVKVAVKDALGSAVESGWSPEYEVAPPLVVSSLAADKGSPQVAGTATVSWKAEASGGVGDRRYEFALSDGKKEIVAQSGPSSVWAWRPADPGSYRVKVAVRDSLGNVAESGWSSDYLVAPPLVVSSLAADKGPPQAAGTVTVRWKAEAQGGFGERAYVFSLSDGKKETEVQQGPTPVWAWRPAEPGSYRVRVAVKDSLENAAESGWSSEFVVAPPLVVSSLAADKGSPQVAGTVTVRWKAEASGGVGDRTYSFFVSDGKGETMAQIGPSPAWDWRPAEPGTYRVKVVAKDSLGNAAESGWSSEYVVAPPLVVFSPAADKVSPQVAGTVTVRWTAEAQGGVGDRTYVFFLSDGKTEDEAQNGSSSAWDWRPREPGSYRVKVAAKDSLGNVAESGWSAAFVVAPPLVVSSLTADRSSPQAAGMVAIRWRAQATGGAGTHTYSFWAFDGKEITGEQSGSSPVWEWRPHAPGSYRVKVTVRDGLGNLAESGWSSEYMVAPFLALASLRPDKDSPQAAGNATVRWTAEAQGGVGDRTYVFSLSDGKKEMEVQSGPAPTWEWRPEKPGSYRVQVAVKDALGNMVRSGWSSEYVVAPPLVVSSLAADKGSPQVAGTVTVRWTAEARGGAGDRAFTFFLSDGTKEIKVQQGPSPIWEWRPESAGSYRVKVAAMDSLGNMAESGWSREFVVALPLMVPSLNPDKASPQAAGTAAVRWAAVTTGGAGDRTYVFFLSDGKKVTEVENGPSAAWEWRPGEPGFYRVKLAAKDSLGNMAESGWSSEYVVAPPLVVSSLAADKASPQAAGTVAVRWKAEVSGGVGERTYTFFLSDGKMEAEVQKGFPPVCEWRPGEPGAYRVRVAVKDSLGNVAESGWSEEFVVAPPLIVSSMTADKDSPQAAGTVTVRWKAEVSGGVGERTHTFFLSDGKTAAEVQKGPSPVFEWRPQSAGSYRVKVAAKDSLGNAAASGWSSEYVVAPPLVVSSLSPDEASPQPAAAPVRWRAEAAGGVGGHTYVFSIADADGERVVQSGPAAEWEWTSRELGTYRTRVAVVDSLGNRAAGDWSEEFRNVFPVDKDSRIAVMPLENLSGRAAPLKAIRESLVALLKEKGFALLPDNELEAFMARHRLRYAGGISGEAGKALMAETGARAVLLTSLDLYDEPVPPKIAFTSRLVSTGEKPGILWMENVAMAGNDAPGLLDLGRVDDPHALRGKALGRVADSLAEFLSRRGPWAILYAAADRGAAGPGPRRFRPKEAYRSDGMAGDRDRVLTVAVLPFLNESGRRNAGELMALHFVRHLAELGSGEIEVVEPGAVRQAMLMSRTIMEGGLSLPQADLLRVMLDVDLVLTGNVMEYQDSRGPWGDPKVDFSARIIDATTRQVVWTSMSQGAGNDGVFFFDAGKVTTAHSLASSMARAVAARILADRTEADMAAGPRTVSPAGNDISD